MADRPHAGGRKGAPGPGATPGAGPEPVSAELDPTLPASSSSDPPPLHPDAAARLGDRLGERYQLRGLLGEGGMGAVYLAWDEVLRKEVALKVVRREGDDDAALEALRREVLLAQRVTHRNVCRTYDLEQAGGLPVLKMEYVAGETLAERLRRSRRLAPAEAVAMAREIAVGLGAAHAQGVVHGDLKPRNVMLEDGTGRVVLMDFGIARAIHLPGEAGDRGLRGTPAYMAPEQVRGANLDGRADLYALGCVLYHMLAGEVPFPAASPLATARRQVEDPPPDPRRAGAAVPAWLARVTSRLLEKDPALRYPDADALVAALAGPPRWRGRRALIAAVAVAGAAGLLHLALGRPPKPAWRPAIAERVPAYDENADPPVISPDGRSLAYVADRDGSYRLYVEPIAGGPARVLGPPGPVGSPRWTHDGRALLVISRRQALRVPLDGGTPEAIAGTAVRAEDCGGRLVVVDPAAPGCSKCPRLVVRIPSDGHDPARERELLRLDPGAIFDGLRCDRAGRQVVYSVVVPPYDPVERLGDLWTLSLDGDGGGDPRPRRLTEDRRNTAPVLAADGRSVIFSSLREGTLGLWEMPIAGGAATPIPSGSRRALAGDVSPDGRVLFFEDDFSSSQVFAQDAVGGGRRKVPHPAGTLWSPEVSPDGRELYALTLREGRRAVLAIPLDGREERTLVAADAYALARASDELVYSRATGAGSPVWAQLLRGGPARLVGELPGRINALAVGADGLVYASIARGGKVSAWRVSLAGGLPSDEGLRGWETVLPAPRGGWRVALRSSLRAAGEVEIRLVAPGQALDDPAAPGLALQKVAWSPAGDSLLYWTGQELRRLLPASGAERRLAALEYNGGFALSPDGQTLYTIELVGHTRRQAITNFADRPRPSLR